MRPRLKIARKQFISGLQKMGGDRSMLRNSRDRLADKLLEYRKSGQKATALAVSRGSKAGRGNKVPRY